MGPDAERMAANGFAVEVVAGVLDNQADVVVPCKIDGKLDMPYTGGFHDVDWPATLGAGPVRLQGWRAGISRCPLRHDACWVVRTAFR